MLLHTTVTCPFSRYVYINIAYTVLLMLFQQEMHLCAAKCCDDKNASIDTVQSCIERCSQPVNRAQRYIQSEMEGFQGRLQRCVMVCYDGTTYRSHLHESICLFYVFSSNATMTSKCKCRRSHQKTKSPNIQHNLNDVPSNVWINILILYRKCSKQ